MWFKLHKVYEYPLTARSQRIAIDSNEIKWSYSIYKRSYYSKRGAVASFLFSFMSNSRSPLKAMKRAWTKSPLWIVCGEKQMLRSTKTIGSIAKTVADDRASFKGEEMNFVLCDHEILKKVYYSHWSLANLNKVVCNRLYMSKKV